MSEQELREGLRAAVAGEPALNFDADALLARAKREIKRRRALVGAGTATAAVAVAAVAVPTLIGVPRGGGSPSGYGAGSPPMDQCATAAVPVPVPPFDPGDITLTVPPSGSYTLKVPVPSGPPTAVKDIGPDVPMPTPTPPPGYPAAGPNVPPTPTGTPCQLPGTPIPPPVSSGPATPTVSTPPVPAAQIKKRAMEMREHLAAVFPKVVPGATKVAVAEFGGEASGSIADGQNYLDTFVSFALKDVRSAVGISVYAPGAGPTPEDSCAEGTCTVSEGPDGTKLVVTTLASSDEAKIISVCYYRADGSVVRATGHNYDPIARGATKHLPEVPVTVAQLTALATDPALGL